MKFTFKVGNTPYETLAEFFENLFYKNHKLAKIALGFFEMVGSKTNGIMASSWRSNISKLFKCYPLNEDDEKALKSVLEKNLDLLKSRGGKNYKTILEKYKNNKIKLDDSEIDVLERAVEWNSAVSGYYSIIKKLRGVGLIEKRKGFFIKSNKFLQTLDRLKGLLDTAEIKENIYVSK